MPFGTVGRTVGPWTGHGLMDNVGSGVRDRATEGDNLGSRYGMGVPL